MSANWHRIPAAARRALAEQTRVDGARVTVTATLEPHVWRQVKDVLELLGAVYLVRASAWEFPLDVDAGAILATALADGRVMAVANAEGFVPTPADLAIDLLAEYGELADQPGTLRVLEPSAGTGRFVDALTDDPHLRLRITAVEPDSRRAAQIEVGDGPVTVVVDTIEAYAERATARFDRVAMNPPFAVPGQPHLWARHLLLAWQLLAPGGRLVAILPATVLDPAPRGRDPRVAADIVRRHGGGSPLDRDAFAESGIDFATAVVWLDRLPEHTPAAPPPAGAAPYLPRSYTGTEPAHPVDRPCLTRAAAASLPVQVWRDPWRGQPRTLRYAADCAVCTIPVWTFDDGENDPRGRLGRHSGGYSMVAADHDSAGPAIALCSWCGNDGTAQRRARHLARQHWTPADAPLPATSIEPPVPTATGRCEQLVLDLIGIDPQPTPSRHRRGRRPAPAGAPA